MSADMQQHSCHLSIGIFGCHLVCKQLSGSRLLLAVTAKLPLCRAVTCPAVFVDGEASRVPQLMLWSAGCYTATALFYSFKSALQVGCSSSLRSSVC
jgi:hypothetical protein